MKHKKITLLVGLSLSCLVNAAQITILMEGVPDTEYVKALIPEYEKLTGDEVNLEVVNYAEMHTKLIPQMVTKKGSYSAIVVDFYWVGEFVKAGWLMPLDDRIKKDKFDTSVYIPRLMSLVGKVNNTTYMLPFYNYAMGLTYRTDLLKNPQNQAAFKAKYGFALKKPQTWDEYLKQVQFFTKGEMKGVVNQGLRPDPIAMEWSNYLLANGGAFYDEQWQARINSPAAAKALQQYVDNVEKYGPMGAASFGFDEAFNVMAQGKAYSYLTYSYFRKTYDDPKKSAVVGKVDIMPVPGIKPGQSGGLNGAWGWAIPKSSNNPDAAWRFLKWVESKDIARKRAFAGGSPTRSDVFDDPILVKKYPYYPELKGILLGSHNFPVFTYTPQLVEVMGRELSLAVAKKKTAADALASISTEMNILAKKDRKQK